MSKFQRKIDHIDLCNDGDVSFKTHDGLFSDFQFVHDALPELAMDELDLSVEFMGETLGAPLMLTGMTGGPAEAGRINHELARLCQDFSIPFGVGSQRVLLRAPEALETFAVRRSAPDVILFGNIGVNQARDMGPDKVKELFEVIEADFLAVHLNAAMELVQPGAESDSDFRDGYDTIGRLVDELDGRLLVKECGAGLSPQVVERLRAVGVAAVDLSGSGGTSWVKVEALRAEGALADLGHLFAEWGIPTLAAVGASASIPGVQTVASGGVSDGLKAAKALAMGATIAGCARPVLQAFTAGGPDGAQRALETMVAAIRTCMALTGARSVHGLRNAQRIVGPSLERWIRQLSREDDDA